MRTTKGLVAGLTAGLTAGLAAGIAGAGAAEGVAAILGVPSPVIAVGGRVIDLAPPALKDFAVSRFGTADKPLLLAGLVLGLAVVSALAGVVGVRRPRIGLGILAAVGLIGVVVSVVPGLVGAAVAVSALALLLRRLRSGPVEDEAPAGFDRRRFLLAALATGAVGAGGGALGRLLAADPPDTAAVPIPSPSSPAPPVPRTVGVDELRRITPFFTPNRDFYRVDVNLDVPRVDARSWRLRVHGLVDRELDLDFEQLVRRRLIERDITLTCVSNEVGGPYVSNARWVGVPIADLLAEAGVRRGADAVKSTAVDGFTIGTPLRTLTDGRDALLAVAMNGSPLPPEHGFPVRMVVPGLYGYVSATKWLVDLEVTRFADFEAYWTRRGWAARAPIKVSSRIDVPKPFARLRAGEVAVAGVAWAQRRGIARVEVRVDDGPWQMARLAREDSEDTWRPWVWRWNAEPGDHTLQVRAIDATGVVQTSRRVPPRPNGSTGRHSVAVNVA